MTTLRENALLVVLRRCVVLGMLEETRLGRSLEFADFDHCRGICHGWSPWKEKEF